MLKKLALLLFFLAGTTLNASSQNRTIDSLQKRIASENKPTVKSQLFFEIAKQYVGENQNALALQNFNFAYQILQDTLTPEAEKVLNEIGLLHYYQGNFTSALQYFKKSLRIAKLNNDTITIGRRLSNIAVIYDHIGDYVQAFKFNQEALAIFEELDSQRGMAFIYNNLGVISEEMGNYHNALEYYHKALRIKVALNDSLGMGNSLNNIGVVFENNLSGYDSSIVYYQQALKIFQDIGNKSGIATSLGNIGVVFWIKQQPDSTIHYSEEALKIRQELNDLEGISSSLLNLGRAWFDKNDFSNAESYFRQSLEISKKLNIRKRISEVYEALALLYYQQNDNTLAFQFHVKYSRLKDSILNEENSRQIAELKTRYELEKKDEKLNELSLKNQIQRQSITRYNYLLGALFFIAVLIATLAILMIRQRRMKVENQTAELQQKLLRSQMNPHFIFNTLFSIQTYIQEKNLATASQFLSRFAKLMRHILENSKHDFVSLQDEMDFLDEYLKTQQLRYGGSFKYNITVIDLDEDPDDLLIPPMMSQPFVENAIEHGLRNIDHQGKIQVLFKVADQMLNIRIEDNGVGFDQGHVNRKQNRKHQSTGIDNTRQRIRLLCDKYRCDHHFKITGISPQSGNSTGTIVTFAIPLILKE